MMNRSEISCDTCLLFDEIARLEALNMKAERVIYNIEQISKDTCDIYDEPDNQIKDILDTITNYRKDKKGK